MKAIIRTSILNHLSLMLLILFLLVSNGYSQINDKQTKPRMTEVTIVDEQFHINGTPTYEGRIWQPEDGDEYSIEGLLMNARLVQAIFDDLNPATMGQFAYPDTRVWDPDRNTDEFIDAMTSWREHGMIAIATNLQGGCPYGYCGSQQWDNSAFAPDGSLRPAYMNRLERILDRADELGMVVILGYFYFGQDGNLEGEQAVINAVDNATEWLLEKDYRNVIVELNNECNINYRSNPILQCDRVHELLKRASSIERNGRSIYIGTSLGGNSVPPPNIVGASDYVLLHGNGVKDPNRIKEMIREVREMEVYTPMPIVSNEDDQPWRVEEQGWGDDGNNLTASVKSYTSWGYFDFRRPEEHENYNLGYQSVPVNWHISSDRKSAFFDKLADITGSLGTPDLEPEFGNDIGKVLVNIEQNGTSATIGAVDLVINNEVVATDVEVPFEFHIEELPEGVHYVKARAIYQSVDTEVSIESPYYKNPWWPYGGEY